jgi:hypothetical protein
MTASEKTVIPPADAHGLRRSRRGAALQFIVLPLEFALVALAHVHLRLQLFLRADKRLLLALKISDLRIANRHLLLQLRDPLAQNRRGAVLGDQVVNPAKHEPEPAARCDRAQSKTGGATS